MSFLVSNGEMPMFAENAYTLAVNGDFSILIDSPGNEEKASSQVTSCNDRLFIPALFLVYAMGDSAWQFTDDALGNDNFNKLFALAYIARCILVGAAQAGASSTINQITARLCRATDSWGTWEVGSSFLTGALWLPFVALGEYLASLTGETDPTSTNSIAITSTTLATCNTITLYLLQYLQNLAQKNQVHASKNKLPSKTADTFAAVGFYAQGIFPQPGSPSSARTVGWAGLFSAGAAATGEVISKVGALAANSLWKCVKNCKSRFHTTTTAASESNALKLQV